MHKRHGQDQQNHEHAQEKAALVFDAEQHQARERIRGKKLRDLTEAEEGQKQIHNEEHPPAAFFEEGCRIADAEPEGVPGGGLFVMMRAMNDVDHAA